MALRRDAARAERYGVVAADATGTIVRLSNVASAEPTGAVARDTFFMGIHALDRSALALVPDGPADIVRTAYAALVPERKVKGIVDPGPWLDTGDLATYLEANLAILRRTVRTALDPHPRAAFARDGAGKTSGDVRVIRGLAEGAVWVGPSAGVDGRIEDSVIGRGARVPAGADLLRVVVWDGVEVPPGAHRDAVFTPAGTASLAT
jgi:mannose-1-phosphate guanylyltransferase